MNARQLKKRLKKEIRALKSDNNLMREIISNSPHMQELYDKYNRPLNTTFTAMQFKEYRTSKVVEDPQYIELHKCELARELFDSVRQDITYEDSVEGPSTILVASLFVGRK